MKPLRFLLAVGTALLLATAAAQDLAPIPPLKHRVTDQAGLLKPAQRAALEKKLQERETKTGSQVAILIVGNTGPEAIEQYGIRVAETWKIGRKGVGDGVILIVAKDTRRTRLEVGRGAEGVITDARAKRILQDVIAPRFRQNDFYGGLNDAVTVIHALLDKEAFPSASQPRANHAAQDKTPSAFALLFLLFPLIIIIAAIVRAKRGGGPDGWGHSSGIYIGGGGWRSGDDQDSNGWGGGDFGGGGGDFGGGGASGSW